MQIRQPAIADAIEKNIGLSKSKLSIVCLPLNCKKNLSEHTSNLVPKTVSVELLSLTLFARQSLPLRATIYGVVGFGSHFSFDFSFEWRINLIWERSHFDCVCSPAALVP